MDDNLAFRGLVAQWVHVWQDRINAGTHKLYGPSRAAHASAEMESVMDGIKVYCIVKAFMLAVHGR